MCPAETGGQGQLLSHVSVLYHGAHIFRQGSLIPSVALRNQHCLLLISPFHLGSVLALVIFLGFKKSGFPRLPQDYTLAVDINMVTCSVQSLGRV